MTYLTHIYISIFTYNIYIKHQNTHLFERRVNVKEFYLLLYSISLTPVSLSSLNLFLYQHTNITSAQHQDHRKIYDVQDDVEVRRDLVKRHSNTR